MGAATLRLLILPLLAATPVPGFAHALAAAGAGDGGFDVAVALLVVALTAWYARGVTRLWRKAGRARGVRPAAVACFALGIVAVAAALLSPLDALASRSFALHMIEHELLMVVAAPLLVLACPLEAWAWGVPAGLQPALRAVARARGVRALFAACTAPASATLLHALALWLWHVPALFVHALASEPVHVLQHACFFASALAFWWAMFGGAGRAPGPASFACLFATMLHTGALGALLTFAPTAWYAQPAAVRVFGLTPLEDQQLGGLIMWVPGGLAYVLAGLAIVASWLASPRMPRSAR